MFETMFKALGEPTRLKILKLLAVKDLCVYLDWIPAKFRIIGQ